jgi:hypothetical protein
VSRRSTDRTPEERARRRNYVVVFTLLALIAIALIIIGTLVVIDSLNGTLNIKNATAVPQ